MQTSDRKTILLTGINGQVGFELQRTLQGLGNVVALDRSRLDLSRLDQVRDVVRDLKPDLIVNPAAYTAVDQAETDVAMATRLNAEAPAVLAEEAKRIGAALIHYSTDYVFSGTKAGPYVEDDPVDLVRQNIDLRISYGDYHYPALKMVRLVHDDVLPVAAPEFWQRHGAADLADHVGQDGERGDHRQRRGGAGAWGQDGREGGG